MIKTRSQASKLWYSETMTGSKCRSTSICSKKCSSSTVQCTQRPIIQFRRQEEEEEGGGSRDSCIHPTQQDTIKDIHRNINK